MAWAHTLHTIDFQTVGQASNVDCYIATISCVTEALDMWRWSDCDKSQKVKDLNVITENMLQPSECVTYDYTSYPDYSPSLCDRFPKAYHFMVCSDPNLHETTSSRHFTPAPCSEHGAVTVSHAYGVCWAQRACRWAMDGAPPAAPAYA